jgi:leucine dehydrogenase
MDTLEQMEQYGHEKILMARDEETGLKAIVAIHSTVLGPAAGGTRFWNYASEDAALYDVLRLSRGMSLKNAAAGLKLGGGKAVLIGEPRKLKSRDYFHAYGRLINSLGGRYYTAEDVNINTTDIGQVHEVTRYVTGTAEISGNPSPFTAHGVYMGMKAGASARLGSDSLSGLTVSVMGLGSVGYSLCEALHKDGARLKVFDINSKAVKRAVDELDAVAVTAEEVLTTDCDVFAPCALGGVLNYENVHSLRCGMVCGAANNVLVDAAAGSALEAKGILYLPDYIVNAGGIINCGEEITAEKYDAGVVMKKVNKIYDTTLHVLDIAKKTGVSTYEAADRYAWNIIRGGAAS